jgi:hypothetical protein
MKMAKIMAVRIHDWTMTIRSSHMNRLLNYQIVSRAVNEKVTTQRFLTQTIL